MVELAAADRVYAIFIILVLITMAMRRDPVGLYHRIVHPLLGDYRESSESYSSHLQHGHRGL